MEENVARKSIATNFPELIINGIRKIGEGTGNVAYEVNHNFIFRFPKKSENQRELEREISLQAVLKKHTSLPIPEFIFLPQNHSFVGYKKLSGIPLLYVLRDYTAWDHFSQQLGYFLSGLHTIPQTELEELNLTVEESSLEDWMKLGQEYFEKTRPLIPENYINSIELFFQSQPPNDNKNVVLCHNDLGIEHILVSGNKITGIIDWGGVALADAACDFARIYRDVGAKILDAVLAEYSTQTIQKDELRERAIFYGKCFVFEDLLYGIEHEEYKDKAIAALRWMF